MRWPRTLSPRSTSSGLPCATSVCFSLSNSTRRALQLEVACRSGAQRRSSTMRFFGTMVLDARRVVLARLSRLRRRRCRRRRPRSWYSPAAPCPGPRARSILRSSKYTVIVSPWARFASAVLPGARHRRGTRSAPCRSRPGCRSRRRVKYTSTRSPVSRLVSPARVGPRARVVDHRVAAHDARRSSARFSRPDLERVAGHRGLVVPRPRAGRAASRGRRASSNSP